MTRNAIVLLSGGLDSATTLAIARADGFAVHALTFRYGQRHAAELESAQAVARFLGAVRHQIIDIDLSVFGGSALTADLPVPKDRAPDERSAGVPVTYVPARNTIFLAYALALAEVAPARDIYLGVNAIDYSGYPDCRPEFIAAFEALANQATRAATELGERIRIHAPLIDASKAEIIRRGRALGVDYAMTSSCYDPDANGVACGRCDACQLRREGFEAAGIADPIAYRG